MATRPRSHIVGDLAVTKVTGIFTQAGWTCEKITQDYGEDPIVRIFDRNMATPKHFLYNRKQLTDLIGMVRKIVPIDIHLKASIFSNGCCSGSLLSSLCMMF
jgi:hypothetical protein